MRFLRIIIVFLLAPSALLAQQKINDLLKNLNAAGSISQKISAYESIVNYYAPKNLDSQNYYAEQAINLSKASNFPSGEADILSQLAVSDKNQGRSELGEQRTNAALKIYREQHNLKKVAQMLLNLGSIEAIKSNFEVATKHYIAALKIYDTVPDTQGQIQVNMNLGKIYLAHDDTANAWKYLKQAVTICKNAPVTDATIYLNNVIGIILASTGHLDSAITIFHNNLALSNKPELIKGYLETLIYVGEAYLQKNDIPKGMEYLDSGLKIARENNLAEMEGNILFDLSNINEKNNPALAIEYLDKALALFEGIQNQSALIDIYKNISRIYKEQGKYKEALQAREKGESIADSIFSINRAREIASIDNTFKLETNRQIRELEMLGKHNATQRDIIIIVAACLIIALIVLIIYFTKTLRLNKQLTAHEKQLEELNSMKDKLFSVIGHDLRGPIARIPAIIDIYEDAETTDDERKFLLDNLKEHTKASLETFDKLLYWGQTLVKGISLHQVRMQPKGYIKEGIELKKMKASEKNITITDHTPHETYIFSDPSLFDFIIRNLLANALKYTHHGGTIDINCDRTSRHCFTIFSVKDSGVGIDASILPKIFHSLKSQKGTDNEKGHGIGLMLCKEFAIQNGGDIWVESEVGKGTTFFFSVKNEA